MEVQNGTKARSYSQPKNSQAKYVCVQSPKKNIVFRLHRLFLDLLVVVLGMSPSAPALGPGGVSHCAIGLVGQTSFSQPSTGTGTPSDEDHVLRSWVNGLSPWILDKKLMDVDHPNFFGFLYLYIYIYIHIHHVCIYIYGVVSRVNGPPPRMREKHVLLGAGTFPGIISKFYIRQIHILLY